jgi:hypothetical protein
MQYTSKIDYEFLKAGFIVVRASQIRPFFWWLSICGQILVFTLALGIAFYGRTPIPAIIMGSVIAYILITPRFRLWLNFRNRQDKNKVAAIDVNETGVSVTVEGMANSNFSWPMYEKAVITKNGIVLITNGGATYQYLRFSDMNEGQTISVTNLVVEKIKNVRNV